MISVACLVLLRPVAVKYRTRGKEFEATPIGQQARVIEAIDPERMTGRVETSDHMTWAAISRTGEVLDVGTVVNVVGQESIKLVVESERR